MYVILDSDIAYNNFHTCMTLYISYQYTHLWLCLWYQNMGSRISQQIRHGRAPTKKIQELKRDFKRLRFDPSQRFTSKTIAQLAKGTDYAHAEKLLYWQAAFPSASSLLILDQYDLQVKAICF
jgi:hypothetical protein